MSDSDDSAFDRFLAREDPLTKAARESDEVSPAHDRFVLDAAQQILAASAPAETAEEEAFAAFLRRDDAISARRAVSEEDGPSRALDDRVLAAALAALPGAERDFQRFLAGEDRLTAIARGATDEAASAEADRRILAAGVSELGGRPTSWWQRLFGVRGDAAPAKSRAEKKQWIPAFAFAAMAVIVSAVILQPEPPRDPDDEAAMARAKTPGGSAPPAVASSGPAAEGASAPGPSIPSGATAAREATPPAKRGPTVVIASGPELAVVRAGKGEIPAQATAPAATADASEELPRSRGMSAEKPARECPGEDSAIPRGDRQEMQAAILQWIQAGCSATAGRLFDAYVARFFGGTASPPGPAATLAPDPESCAPAAARVPLVAPQERPKAFIELERAGCRQAARIVAEEHLRQMSRPVRQ